MPKRPLPPIGFWSYARPDDEFSCGVATLFMSGASGEVLTLAEIGTGEAETWFACPN